MSVWAYIQAGWETRLRADPGLATDCSYCDEHRPHHHPHPDTGRPVCNICHPPPESK